jgi:hypothetical protein
MHIVIIRSSNPYMKHKMLPPLHTYVECGFGQMTTITQTLIRRVKADDQLDDVV